MKKVYMKKVIVIGCPGSGKTTFSEKLSKKTGIPLYYLDTIWHRPDRTHIPVEEFEDRLAKIYAKDEWIIDGNYASTMELRLKECDTVIFLDYPLELCLEGISQRQGKVRSDMPWVETEEDGEFIEFVKRFNAESRPQIMDLLRKYSDKNVFVFTDRAQASDFLDTLEG
jgi:adenylate kinase family enzyme